MYYNIIASSIKKNIVALLPAALLQLYRHHIIDAILNKVADNRVIVVHEAEVKYWKQIIIGLALTT